MNLYALYGSNNKLIQLSIPSFFTSNYFCKPRKELPLVAFSQQQKLVFSFKKLSIAIWASSASSRQKAESATEKQNV